jgi:hypothetical protein
MLTYDRWLCDETEGLNQNMPASEGDSSDEESTDKRVSIKDLPTINVEPDVKVEDTGMS